VSKRLHTLPTVSTREADRFWTSCRQKRLKYCVNERGVRCAGHWKSACLTLQRVCGGSYLRRTINLQQRALAPEVGFGASFSCICPQLSSLHLSNQADSVTTGVSSFTAFCWQLKPEKPAIPRRRQMRLISIPMLGDHPVLHTEHVEP
jgi:hypothetical protein